MSKLEIGKYYIIIKGNEEDIERYMDFALELNFEIIKYDDAFLLTSEEIKNAKSQEDVYIFGEEALNDIHGIHNFIFGFTRKIWIDSVMVPLQDGSRQITMKFGTMRIVERAVVPSKVKEAISIAKTSIKHPVVKEVFRYYRRGLNYFDFYKIYEIVREDCGKKNTILERGYLSKTECERLTANLNHPKLAGEKGRHARMTGEPDKTLYATRQELFQWINKLVIAWINDKYPISGGNN